MGTRTRQARGPRETPHCGADRARRWGWRRTRPEPTRPAVIGPAARAADPRPPSSPGIAHGRDRLRGLPIAPDPGVLSGRTQLEYLKKLAARAGHAIDLTRITAATLSPQRIAGLVVAPAAARPVFACAHPCRGNAHPRARFAPRSSPRSARRGACPGLRSGDFADRRCVRFRSHPSGRLRHRAARFRLRRRRRAVPPPRHAPLHHAAHECIGGCADPGAPCRSHRSRHLRSALRSARRSTAAAAPMSRARRRRFPEH